MPFRLCIKSSSKAVLAVLLTSSFTHSAPAQTIGQGRWAAANDPVALQLIDVERKWAVLECEPTDVVNGYLAEDFVGTSPEGPLYTKADYLAEPQPPPGSVHGCKLLSARVRFYGDNLAMIYGSETSVRKDKAGKEYNRKLVWTDTWVKRSGKWQIIAVQDMHMPS
jgi:Domain of unknown function (DUF4440)